MDLTDAFAHLPPRDMLVNGEGRISQDQEARGGIILIVETMQMFLILFLPLRVPK
jgi:hypothetical protein